MQNRETTFGPNIQREKAKVGIEALEQYITTLEQAVLVLDDLAGNALRRFEKEEDFDPIAVLHDLHTVAHDANHNGVAPRSLRVKDYSRSA